MLRPTACQPFPMEETNSIAIVVEAPRDPPNAPIRKPIDELCPTAKSSDKMKINELIPHESHVHVGHGA